MKGIHKNLTLERILSDEPPVPEFRYCKRCGNSLPERREGEQCSDCEGALKFHPRGTQGQRLPQYHPAYEVSLHYSQQPKQDLTIATLEAMNIPYIIYLAKRDPIEVEWAKNLTNPELHPDWPIVVISAHGKLIDWWTGFDLFQLNAIPAARATAIQMSQTPQGFEVRSTQQPGVPIEQEQAA